MPKKSNLKKQMTGTPDFSFVESKVEIHDDARLAKFLLEKPETYNVLVNLDRKLFELVKAKAIIDFLGKEGLPLATEDILRVKGVTGVQVAVNHLLSDLVGKKQDESTGVEAGNLDEAGYFGMNPQAIRNVIFKDGNLRERIYLLYRDGYSGFSDKIFADPMAIDNHNLVLRIIGADWQIDKAQIEEIKTEGNCNTPYARGIYSRFNRDEGLRATRSDSEKKQWVMEHNHKIAEDEKRTSPLTLREKLSKTGELPFRPLYESKSRITDPYISGSAIYKKAEKDHPFFKMGEAIREPFAAGASGITDTILTFALCVNSSREELIALRDAAVVSMIEDKSHSPHEVMFAAKSFGLPYTPGELYELNQEKDFNKHSTQHIERDGSAISCMRS